MSEFILEQLYKLQERVVKLEANKMTIVETKNIPDKSDLSNIFDFTMDALKIAGKLPPGTDKILEALKLGDIKGILTGLAFQKKRKAIDKAMEEEAERVKNDKMKKIIEISKERIPMNPDVQVFDLGPMESDEIRRTDPESIRNAPIDIEVGQRSYSVINWKDHVIEDFGGREKNTGYFIMGFEGEGPIYTFFPNSQVHSSHGLSKAFREDWSDKGIRLMINNFMIVRVTSGKVTGRSRIIKFN